MRFLLTAFVVPGLVFLGPPLRGAADESTKDATPSASELSLETDALRLLYYLKATPEQLRLLKQAAPQTMQKPRTRAGKAGKDYRRVLEGLCDALTQAKDAERIDRLEDELDRLNQSEPPDLDDGVDITDAARHQAPEVLRRFKAPQLAAYIARVADQVADPEDDLLEALKDVRAWKADEWKQKREEVAEEIGRLVAGLDPAKAEKVSDQVIALLIRARDLGDDDFKKQQPDLAAKARAITAAAGPDEVLRHTLEYAVAHLLSNPRLEAAVTARLK